MKFQRQSRLLEIIERHEIETQEELSERLRALGFQTTQATISRDIKELRICKVLTERGVYKYAVSAGENDMGFTNRLRTIFRESVTTCDCAQNIVVVKTLPGLASAACSALDQMKLPHLVGTIGGDDTAFLLLRDNDAAQEFLAFIEEMRT